MMMSHRFRKWSKSVLLIIPGLKKGWRVAHVWNLLQDVQEEEASDGAQRESPREQTTFQMWRMWKGFQNKEQPDWTSGHAHRNKALPGNFNLHRERERKIWNLSPTLNWYILPFTLEMSFFQCDQCPLSFSNKSNMDRHRARYHIPDSEKKVFICPECNGFYTRRCSLKAHMKYTGCKGEIKVMTGMATTQFYLLSYSKKLRFRM